MTNKITQSLDEKRYGSYRGAPYKTNRWSDTGKRIAFLSILVYVFIQIDILIYLIFLGLIFMVIGAFRK